MYAQYACVRDQDVHFVSLCSFNELCLPDHATYEAFEAALKIAITEGSEGFGVVWSHASHGDTQFSMTHSMMCVYYRTVILIMHYKWSYIDTFIQSTVRSLAATSDTIHSTPCSRFSLVKALHLIICQWWVRIDFKSSTCIIMYTVVCVQGPIILATKSNF